MWSYYGAKTNIVDFYPKPVHDKIIEPFAGTARYSLKYFEKDVLLIDKYEVIIKIWKWLQKCSPKDILGLPRFKAGENINEFDYDCEEQRFLLGFLACVGAPHPKQTAKFRAWGGNKLEKNLKQISENLFKIKHWKFKHSCYSKIKNQKATWFIDAPYQEGGHYYKKSNKKIDYINLADYCRNRVGQVIVCENKKATWMDFSPLTTTTGIIGKQHEVLWCNYPTHFNNKQLQLNFIK